MSLPIGGSFAAQPEITRQLGPSEQVRWSGRPRGGIRFQAADIFLIPFSLVWLGGVSTIVFPAMFSQATAKNVPPFPFLLIPFFFVIVGTYFCFGRFVFDAWSRARTAYAVTNERVLIVSGIFSRRVKSLNLRTLSDLTLSEKRDGSGTIQFGPSGSPLAGWMQVPGWTTGFASSPSFARIESAREVYELIRGAQREAT